MSEGSVFFEGQGAVQQAMRRICKRLDDLGVPYAIVGGMALFQHGFRRFTEDGENENVAKPGSPFVVAVES